MPPHSLFAQLINGDESDGGLSIGMRRLLCLHSPSQALSEEALDARVSPLGGHRCSLRAHSGINTKVL